MDDTSWQDRAACRGHDTDLFYDCEEIAVRRALALCDRCEVRDPCRAQALDHRERFGVWGGTTETERRRVYRREGRERRRGQDSTAA